MRPSHGPAALTVLMALSVLASYAAAKTIPRSEAFFGVQIVLMLTCWVCGLLVTGYIIFRHAGGIREKLLKAGLSVLSAAISLTLVWLIITFAVS